MVLSGSGKTRVLLVTGVDNNKAIVITGQKTIVNFPINNTAETRQQPIIDLWHVIE